MSKPEPLLPLPSCDILNELLSYDPATGVILFRHRDRKWFDSDRIWKCWNTRYAGGPALTAKGRGYRKGTLLGTFYMAHRVAWKMVYGFDPLYIDHMNGNRSDNRIANLRDVTRMENMKNMHQLRTNTTGVTGVYWDKSKQKWTAEIVADGKKRHLGRFPTMGEACAARKTAEKLLGFSKRHGLEKTEQAA